MRLFRLTESTPSVNISTAFRRPSHSDQNHYRNITQRIFVQDIVEDALEDISLVRAIEQGLHSKPVSRAAIYKSLEGLVKTAFRDSFAKDPRISEIRRY